MIGILSFGMAVGASLNAFVIKRFALGAICLAAIAAFVLALILTAE